MTSRLFTSELLVLLSELQTLVASSEPTQTLSLARRVLEKTDEFDTTLITEEKTCMILEDYGVNMWNYATTYMLETSLTSNDLNQTRAILYHIGYKMLSEAYRSICEDDMNVLLQLSEMAIFTGSEYTVSHQFTRTTELLELAHQCIQRIKRQAHKNDQHPSISHQLSRRQNDLMMAYVELFAKQGNWKEVKTYIQKIDVIPEQNVGMLYYFCFKVASDFVDTKQWNHALRWTISFCSNCNDYTQMEEYLLARLAQLICIAVEGKIDNILDVAHIHRLLDIIDGCFKSSRTSFEFHCTKLMVLMAGSQPFSSHLELAFCSMTETLDIISEENCQLTQRLGSLLMHLADKLSVDHLVGGLNIYIHRCLDCHYAQESDTLFQQLYLFKLYIFSEWISIKADTIDQLPHYMDTIKTMMDEMYLVKDRLTNQDLWCCQMIMWSVGDTFFKNENYVCALPWYKQIWNFGLTSLKIEMNLLALARKLTTCSLQLGNSNNAGNYMETIISDSDASMTALDYLLLLEINIVNKNNTKAGHYLSLLFHAKGFTSEILMSAAYLCHKNKNGVLMQKLLDCAFDISDKYMDQELFNVRFTTLLRWTIRFTLNIKHGNDFNAKGLLINKDAIIMCLEKAATYFASLTGPMREVLKDDKEWVLRTGWNIGLHFYNRNQDAEGAMLFAVAVKMICLDLPQSALNDQYLSCLLVCLASRLFSSSFNEIDGSDRLCICNDTLSLIKQVSDVKPEIGNNNAFVSIVALIQTQCYATLTMFEDGLNAFNEYGDWLGQTANMNALEIFECLAEIILQHKSCPQTVAKNVLKTITSVFCRECHLDDTNVEKWAKWNRLYVSLVMEDHQSTDDIFNYITQLCTSLSMEVGIPYPQKEIHYLVVITWNEGMTHSHNSDTILGERWCRLAHDLSSRLDSSHNALKDQIQRALPNF